MTTRVPEATNRILSTHAHILTNYFGPDWALYDPDDLRARRGECAQWLYVGSDPALEEAKIICRLRIEHGTVRWDWFGGCAVTAYTWYPLDCLTDRDRYLTTITVNPTRPLAQIAQDVQRRLLPRWLPMYAKARRAWREAQREEVSL
jgi:hypothetical protein